MPTTAQDVKDRAYARLAEKTRTVPDENDQVNTTYDPEDGTLTIPEIEKPLELTFEMQAIIDSIVEAVIEKAEEDGLLLGDTEASKMDVG